MGIFSQVLLASDFDHTLTNMDGIVPARNLEAIEAFIAEGGIFTVASGRSIPMFRKKAALLPVNAPCILYNGAACYDYRAEALAFAVPLPDTAPRLLAALREHCPRERIEIHTIDRHYVYGRDPHRDALLDQCGVSYLYDVPNPPLPWIKLAVFGKARSAGYDDPARIPPEEVAYFDRLQDYVAQVGGDGYASFRAMPRNMEVCAAGCDKGGAARALAQSLGRPILACIGDAPNDLTMLRAADYGFRTGDCDISLRDLPFLPAAPSGEGSVASAISQLRRLL